MTSVAAAQEKLPALLDGLRNKKICIDTKWEPIKDINSPKVQEAGRCAVMEYNVEAGKNLKFKRVVNGLRRTLCLIPIFPFEAFLLKLVVEAINEDGIAWTYETEVLDVSCLGIFKLISFEEILHY